MRKFILGLIIGLIISSSLVYGLRLESLPTFTDFTDKNQITKLNNYLEKVQTILNGRITLDVVTSVPTSTNANEGDIRVSKVGTTYKIHIFVNGAWRSVIIS